MQYYGCVYSESEVIFTDETLIAIFGMTNEQRETRKADIKAVRSDQEASIFDIPAVERLVKR